MVQHLREDVHVVGGFVDHLEPVPGGHWASQGLQIHPVYLRF